MINTRSTGAKELYEVNLHIELDYPQILDANGNKGSGRYENNLPDWNLIFLTELDDDATADDFLNDARHRFPSEIGDFLKRYKDSICSIDVEYHSLQEEGCNQPDWDEILIEENECIWESHWDDWEEHDDDD